MSCIYCLKHLPPGYNLCSNECAYKSMCSKCEDLSNPEELEKIGEDMYCKKCIPTTCIKCNKLYTDCECANIKKRFEKLQKQTKCKLCYGNINLDDYKQECFEPYKYDIYGSKGYLICEKCMNILYI
jgi:hypothetical protein